MPTPFNIYLRDMIPAEARRLTLWSDQKKTQIQRRLTGHFQQVCQTTRYQPQVTWVAAVPTLARHELVLYYSPTRTRCITQELGIDIDGTEAGMTSWVNTTMLSEVFAGEDATAGPDGMADTSFHELMHNKLDVHPTLRSVGSIHSRGGGGIARQPPGNTLTTRNIVLMRAALGRPIPQFIR
jgi:hypothetical protein